MQMHVHIFKSSQLEGSDAGDLLYIHRQNFHFPAKLRPVVWVKFKWMHIYILNNKGKTDYDLTVKISSTVTDHLKVCHSL